MVTGISLAATIAGGTAFLDSALSCAFGGAVLASIASTGARNPLNAVLRRGPLAYYGKISYGLYMIHIMVFIYYGWFDLRMDKYGMAGNLAVVGVRLAASTLAATVLWYGFESQILKLKRHFLTAGLGLSPLKRIHAIFLAKPHREVSIASDEVSLRRQQSHPGTLVTSITRGSPAPLLA